MRPKSRITPLIFATFLLVLLASRASAQERIWRPYIELQGRANSLRQLGQGNLFLPLSQDDDELLFADFRGLWTDGDAAEGNWGLAYRKILPSEWIVGVYGFYDFRHSELGNEFHQGVVGAELLSVNWGFRVNGYIPDQDAKSVPGLNGAFLQGNNIVVRSGLEAAYWGVDFEAERLLWCRDGYGCNSFSEWHLGALDAQIWAAAGVFHFDNNANGFEDITGPRVRAELRLYDLPMLGDDSRLVLSGQYEHDDVRGSVGSGMLTVRIPFGRGGCRNASRLSSLGRRMVTPIVRDIDVVTNAGALEPALFARTGEVISGAVIVDGNTVDPENVIEGAGADSVAIADGSAGTIFPADTIDMNVGQMLMGGGSSLAVIGANTGTMATFTAPGTRGAINSGNNDAIDAATNGCIQSVDIATTGNSDQGIRLNNDTNVLIDDVAINTSGNASDGIDSRNNSQFTLNNSTITVAGTGADGIQVVGNGQFTVNGGSITTTGTTSRGVRVVPVGGETQTFLLSGVTINSSGTGVFLDGVINSAGMINATITGSTITSGGAAREISVVSDGTTVYCLNIFGNTLDSGAGRIRLNEFSGDINVTQLDPAGPPNPNRLDTANGIPAANVIIPRGAPLFNQAPCPTP